MGDNTFFPLSFGDGAYLSVCHLGYCKFSFITSPSTLPDPEAVPFSRTPSPIPPPITGYGRRSRHSSFRAGKHYNYDSIPTSDAEDEGEGDTRKRERGPSRKGSILSSKRDSVLGLSIGGDTNLDKPPSRLGPSLGDRRESQLSATSATSNGGVGESRNGVIGGSRRNSRFRAKSDTE